MPATKRPHVPLEQRREELVETAVRVMARDGAWALTTRAVATEAGVPHGTVHYAFSSKDELLRAVLRRDLTGFAALIETARHDTGGIAHPDARSALTALFTTYADHVIAAPETETAYFELSLMASRDPELRDLVRETEFEYSTLFTAYLTDLAERSDATWDAELEVLATLIQSTVFGAAMSWLEHRDDALFRAALEDAAALFAGRLHRT